ncbi:MAG: hypothetical protein K0V04_18895 [Deltaproteobacteria bacterium]|nr:hypothetical protein [Deltaproteobacteria bacterium]
MLRELELLLVPVVASAVPNAVLVDRGPFEAGPPWPNNRRVIRINARRLEVHETPPPKTADAPAFVVATATWPIDGVTDAFTLPAVPEGEVVEVEAPIGFLARRGDDYYVDGDTIRFYRVPTGAGNVLARLRVAEASGYARRSACTVTLDVTAYSREVDTADPLMEEAMQLVLVELQRVPYLVADDGGLGTFVRLSRTRAYLRTIERTLTDYQDVVSCAATIELTGELDFIMPTGAPEPVGIIEQVDGELEVEVEGVQTPPPVEFSIEASEDPPPGDP